MEFINNYSGIIALFVYGILLFLLMSFTKKKEVKEETEEVKTVNAARTQRSSAAKNAIKMWRSEMSGGVLNESL